MVQARDEGGLDQGGSSHGGENFESGSTLQIRLRIADGLDGGGEKKQLGEWGCFIQDGEDCDRKKLWREINNSVLVLL